MRMGDYEEESERLLERAHDRTTGERDDVLMAIAYGVQALTNAVLALAKTVRERGTS